MPLEDLIIRVYLQVSDFFDYSLGGKRLRACGSSPNLSDQEVLSINMTSLERRRHDLIAQYSSLTLKVG